MTEYFRGAFFYLLCFFAGCGFAALVFSWSLRSHSAEPGTETGQRDLQKALSFALRQLAFFLLLGTFSFVMVGGLLWLRGKSQSEPAPSTPSQAAAPQNLGSSPLTGVLLPTGATTVTDSSILGTSSDQLQRLVNQVDSQSQLGASEVLMWRDAARQQANARITEVEKALKSNGWIYKETSQTSTPASGSAPGGVREFVAVNTKRKQIVPGFWLITDQFLLLSWGEAKPS